MPIQDFSFDPRDPLFPLAGAPTGVRWGLQVFTTDNVYVLDRTRCRLSGDAAHMTCDALAWAGQQRSQPGGAEVRIERDGPAWVFRIRAHHAREPVKSVKLLIRGLPEQILRAGWWRATTGVESPNTLVNDQSLVYWRYPAGWDWTTPWACAGDQTHGPCLTLSARDAQVRAKRLVVHCPRYGGEGGPAGDLAEFVLEQDARRFAPAFDDVPEVRLALHDKRASVDADFQRHLAFLETAYRLPRWEDRPDVPAWARDVRLVLNLHGQHWTGYLFNTFDRMAQTLDLVAREVPGKTVLAYVLGWEGRYYHSYPNYWPGPDLGGPEGFARLREASRRTGIRLLPMFGAHGANVTQYADWATSAWRDRLGNTIEMFNRPDWDSDRSGEEQQLFLHPHEPRFRAHLLEQISRLVTAYDLDTAYLDTTAAWVNDPRWDMAEGYRLLLAELRQRHPGLFVAGEAWWDALWAHFPMVLSWQRSEKRMRQPELLTRYGRAIHHIERGGAGLGSTGVHEAGFRDEGVVHNVAPGILPSFNVVDTTLDTKAEVQALLDLAHHATSPSH